MTYSYVGPHCSQLPSLCFVCQPSSLCLLPQERDYLPAKRLGMNALLLVRGDAPSRQAEKADPNDIVTSLSEVLSRI